MTFLSKKSAFAYSALAISMMASEAHALAIQGLSASQVSDSITQLRISFDGQPIAPVAYQQAGSNQLMLDFNQVSSNGLPRNMPINRGVVNDVTALNSGQLTRLVVGLNNTASYSSAIEGNQLLINVAGQAMQPVMTPTPAPVVALEPTLAPVMVTPTPVAPAPVAEPMVVKVNPLLAPTTGSISTSYNGISAVNYAGKGKNGGNITIALTNEAIPVDVQRQGNKVVIRTAGTTIPRHLLRQIQGNGLVNSINATNQGTSGVVTINMSGDYEYQAYQSGASLHISILPPKQLREPTLEEKVYTGEPLSLEFQDVSVRTVLDVLGQFTETNIVANDNVTGNITLRLVNVPWDQALDIILKSKNLGMRKNGNVIIVAPAQELSDQEIKALEDLDKAKNLLPLRTEYIRLNYANAADVLKLLDDADSPGSAGDGTGKTSLLSSSRGVITSDARTNTIIVKDTSEGIADIRAMIDKIDIPVKQVMIEARIVTASESFSKEIGVRWGKGRNPDASPLKSDSLGLAVNLGTTASPTSAFSIGLLSISDMLLDLTLAAMQAENRGEVISAPKVLTADKQTAKISSGKQIPYENATASGATAVSFKEAALSLEATPSITPDGKVAIKLQVKNADVGEVYAGVPSIREDSITTNVLLEDGQTVVLGGAFRHKTSLGENKVPFLGDIPGVGRLFKSDAKLNDKQELLIFVTPRVINDGISRID